MKQSICTLLGVLGGAVASAFGGFDGALVTLVLFMGADYLSGLVVAGVFHNSGKSRDGALDSRAGFKGLFRKGMVLVLVLAAARLDLLLGADFLRDAVCIGFTANELISIVENAGLMGLPIPAVLTRAIDILQTKAEGTGMASEE